MQSADAVSAPLPHRYEPAARAETRTLRRGINRFVRSFDPSLNVFFSPVTLIWTLSVSGNELRFSPCDIPVEGGQLSCMCYCVSTALKNKLKITETLCWHFRENVLVNKHLFICLFILLWTR